MSEKLYKWKKVNKWFGDFQVLKNIDLRSFSETKNCSMWTIGIRKIYIN